jgi:KipI family sensor histidine kinase inhibitor
MPSSREKVLQDCSTIGYPDGTRLIGAAMPQTIDATADTGKVNGTPVSRKAVMRVLPCADSGLLVELGGLDAVQALHAALKADLPAGVTDLVPAARTLLLQLDPQHADVIEIERVVRAARLPGRVRHEQEPVRIPVTYGGEDLNAVAQLTGLTEREVVAAHTGSEWRVSFTGFTPGFGYLSGGSPMLVVPRRAESRVRIPAGSVALAGSFSGIYPRESPGGWQLIGHTEVETWHPDRDPPAVLTPGTRVRFQDAG